MKKLMILLLFLTPVLSGCWDQRLIKDTKLVMSASLDKKDGKLYDVVSIPNPQRSLEGGSPQEQIQVEDAFGSNVWDARNVIDRKVAQKFDISKNKILLLGSDLVSGDIFPYLDVFYRDPRSNLNAQLAIVQGQAHEALYIKPPGETKISDYLVGVINSAIRESLVPKEDIQSISDSLYNDSKDFALPLISVDKENDQVKIVGVALFHGHKYTKKYIDVSVSPLFLMLMNRKNIENRIILKVQDGEKPKINNYVTLEIEAVNRKMIVDVNDENEVTAHINLKLDGNIVEYPLNHLYKPAEIKEIEHRAEARLKKQAIKILAETKNANSDVLGVGERVKAFHHKTWTEMDWNKVYPKVNYDLKLKLDINYHGITD